MSPRCCTGCTTRPHWLAAPTHSCPTLQVTSAEHILFGTDWPAAPETTVVRNIANLTNFAGFTAEELRGVERDNALRLFPRFAITGITVTTW